MPGQVLGRFRLLSSLRGIGKLLTLQVSRHREVFLRAGGRTGKVCLIVASGHRA
jgi:hypothetical protein